MPEVESWILRPFQPLYGMRAKKGGYAKEEMLMESAYDISASPVELQEEYSLPIERGTSVTYNLQNKVSINSDGAKHKLPISSQELKADFKYSTYPGSVSAAYLGSQVVNDPNLQLLTGKVNIFLEGEFVGTSHLGSIGPGEEFELSLGVDENVKVKRELIEKKTNGVFLGGNKQTMFKYKITIENYKSKSIGIKIFESMPVSEEAKIKVKLGEVNIEPSVKDWQDKRGVWLWEMELATKEKKEIIYSYIVEYPSNMQIEGI